MDKGLKELFARLLAERFVDIGSKLVEEGTVDISDVSDDEDSDELADWETLEDEERVFFVKVMERLLDETFLAGAITVTQGDSLLFVLNDPGYEIETAMEIQQSVKKLFDGVKVDVLVGGEGVSVIKGQQPLCGARITEPVFNKNSQELNEQAQSPCILRGEHKGYAHKNVYGVEWKLGGSVGVFEEQNGSEHEAAYAKTDDIFPTNDQI